MMEIVVHVWWWFVKQLLWIVDQAENLVVNGIAWFMYLFWWPIEPFSKTQQEENEQ